MKTLNSHAYVNTVVSASANNCSSYRENNEGFQVKNWRSRSGDIPIKGVTSVEKISLVTLEGANAIGKCVKYVHELCSYQPKAKK